MEIKRLTAANYDEWLELLNAVFTRHNNREMHFDQSLPKMCIRDDEHMGMHLGIWEDGGLRALLGIYPIPAKIAGQDVLFSTVGNVATHWDYEGRGYMAALMAAAMEELDRIGADASRLGGMRQHYERFGYEPCGSVYSFSLTAHNVQRGLPGFSSDLRFERLTRDNLDGIRAANAFNESAAIHAVRSEACDCRDVWNSMIAWENQPWLALRPDGSIAGYLSASPDGSGIAEQGAVSDEVLLEMLAAWQGKVGTAVSFRLQPWQAGAVQRFSKICQSGSISAPCHIFVRSWDKVTDALMKLKFSYAPMPEGELVVEILGYGAIRLYVKHGEAGCERTNASADVVLDHLAAARYLYGPHAPWYAGDANELAAAWLPLPLSWNLQDRV